MRVRCRKKWQSTALADSRMMRCVKLCCAKCYTALEVCALVEATRLSYAATHISCPKLQTCSWCPPRISHLPLLPCCVRSLVARTL